MEITEGTIRTYKSWWYIIDYFQKRGKWIATDIGMDLDLFVTELDGIRVSIPKLRCDKVAEILGVWIDPN